MNSTLIFIETMASNPLVIVSAYLLSLLSVILAIILYIKSKKMKIPCYATNTINIFRDYNSNIESLEILYGGKLINNLSITKLAFWNAGKETIKKADLP
ncbi:MAG: hypothetical protein Q8L00_03775, partial [Deltaproteobacteria bacterium]|nr:hypothetical protein [Deltaproteobacteria bacterium]